MPDSPTRKELNGNGTGYLCVPLLWIVADLPRAQSLKQISNHGLHSRRTIALVSKTILYTKQMAVKKSIARRREIVVLNRGHGRLVHPTPPNRAIIRTINAIFQRCFSHQKPGGFKDGCTYIFLTSHLFRLRSRSMHALCLQTPCHASNPDLDYASTEYSNTSL